MPENVGGIEYTVDADTSDLLKSQKIVDSATDSMAQSFKGADKAAAAMGKTVGALNTPISKTTSAVRKANSAFKIQKGAVQQVGFQVQDFAVQVAGGTSALTAFGQQGSQVAGILGPGGAVIGAIIAVASAIGGVLLASTEDAVEEVEKLEVTFDGLVETIGRLTKAQEKYLATLATQRIDDLNEQLDTARARAETLYVQLARFPNNDNAKKWREEVKRLHAEIDTGFQQVVKYNKIIRAAADNNEDWADENERASSEVERLVDRLQLKAKGIVEVDGALQASARAEALATAETLNATAAQIDSINASFDRIDALKEQKDALRALQAQEKQAQTRQRSQDRSDLGLIEKLRKDLASEEELINQSHGERQDAILRQTKQGSEKQSQLLMDSDALRSQQLKELADREIEENRRKIEAIQEMERKAAEEKREREIQALQEQFNISEQTAERLRDLAKEAANVAESINSSFTNALLNVGDRFSDVFANAIVQGNSLSQALRGVAQSFLTEVLSSLIKVGARIAINAAIGQTAAATSTATAAATGAAIAAAYAPAAALVSLATLGANAAPAAAALASTTALSTTLAAVPGLQTGGPIGAGQLRRVNENGPELFTDGARQFLLPDRAGNVVSNSDASNSGNNTPLNINFNVQNTASGAQFEVESVNQTGTEVTVNAIVADIRSGNGPVSRALYESTNVTSRANG